MPGLWGRGAFVILLGTASLGLDTSLTSAQSADRLHRDYRARLLGVYDDQTGQPIAGAEVMDVISQRYGVTSSTGTVSLAFLPEGGSLVRVRKIGYEAIALFASVSPQDTVPITLVLEPTATMLPATVSRDSNPYVSPNLRAFEDRRRTGMGHFIAEAELRKHDNEPLSSLVMSLPGLKVECRRGCVALSARAASPHPFLQGGGCPVAIYVDGVRYDNGAADLTKLRVDQYGGVEFYAGPASMPPQFNMTRDACGVLLLWTRER